MGRINGLAPLILIATTIGCTSPNPSPSPQDSLPTFSIQCLVHPVALCESVVNAAQSIVTLDGSNVVVTIDRGPVFHADVHACYPDGRYVLIDVVGDDLRADIRQEGWEIPPCRPTPT